MTPEYDDSEFEKVISSSFPEQELNAPERAVADKLLSLTAVAEPGSTIVLHTDERSKHQLHLILRGAECEVIEMKRGHGRRAFIVDLDSGATIKGYMENEHSFPLMGRMDVHQTSEEAAQELLGLLELKQQSPAQSPWQRLVGFIALGKR